MSAGKQKIAVLGSDGQLGADLVLAFKDDFDVIGFTRADFDVTDSVTVAQKILEIKPYFVINAAVFHGIPECEKDPQRSFSVNAVGAYNVAKAAAAIGAGVVYVSTDYVFGGEKSSFTEDDAPHPLNIYGASKFAGEILTRMANPEYYIVRSSGFFGVHQSKSKERPNFVMQMLARAKEGKEFPVVNDQFVSPTFTEDLSKKIKEIIEKKVPFGIYHITNEGGGISWYEFAKEIFEIEKLSPRFMPTTIKERSGDIVVPASSILENRALPEAGIMPLRPLSEALRAYLHKLNKIV